MNTADLSALEAREFFNGEQWSDHQLDGLRYGGTVTGRISGGPMQFNTIKKEPQMSIEDRDMLNPLDQPTRYEAARKRAKALARYLEVCQGLALARLSGGSDIWGKLVIAYMNKYQFTEEELNGSSTQA